METLYRERLEVDVCVVGGGMSGLCAAVASARNGARTVLVHDRPVLGGNASSEVRMWICGAGADARETGILEELKLEHSYRNPSGNWSIWDSVLYGMVAFQPNLQTLLNTSCCDAEVSGGRIEAIRAWQLTSQTWYTIHAHQFIDCSGDSILAPLAGADCRRGREARHEYDEDIEPSAADDKTMGNSILIQLRRTDEPQPFIPPSWAVRFEDPEQLPHRMRGVNGTNFWWIELGGLVDTIGDASAIKDDLMQVAWGVWDYIKNVAPERDQAENWALEWIGSLPGKRENRRYLGPHVLTQNDIRAGGDFSDIVAYGGWSMDDHHPAGLLYPGKPTIFHPAPSPYGIPYRSLYSRNVENLLFAGRNISVTHAALSSTRVMATCSLLGQAAGTAAALCIRHGCDPDGLYPAHLPQLQATLQRDDVWLPGKLRAIADLTRQASLNGDGEMPQRLLDGVDRDLPDDPHGWLCEPGASATLTWDTTVNIRHVRLVFDSNLRDSKRMPCSYPLKGDRCTVPTHLVKQFRLEAHRDGAWETVYREAQNHQRLVELDLNVRATSLRLLPESTWGADSCRVFAFEADDEPQRKRPETPRGPTFQELVDRVPAADLAPPEHGLEDKERRHGA